MNAHLRVQALIDAHRNGTLEEVSARFSAELQSRALNNLNLNNNYNLKQGVDHDPQPDHGFSSKRSNLNNLKASGEKKRGGVPRLKLYTDETLKKALAWGVEEWLIQVSIRDYGEYTVKGQINRIYQIPDGYFKPQYGPIEGQRGKLFNREMQKLKDKAPASQNCP